MKQRPIKLPEDMNPHDTTIEWWYFNGHLADKKGNRYSFMDCLFRADVKKVKIPYLKGFTNRLKTPKFAAFAHTVIADLGRKKAIRRFRTSRSSRAGQASHARCSL